MRSFRGTVIIPPRPADAGAVRSTKLGENMSLLAFLAATTRTLRLAAALGMGICLASSASALTIDITGVAGSGTSVWTFGGTTTASGLFSTADGAFAFGTGNQNSSLNGFFNSFPGGDFGTFFASSALGAGVGITGSSSGAHVLEGS